MNLQSTITLNNGVAMPWLGLGTFKVANQDECIASVIDALQIGYRHIDTAKIYGNESFVGTGIRESGIKREKIFITTKVWNEDQGYESTLKAFDESLKQLRIDYLDLYLIHWPGKVNPDTWKALEKLYAEKRVRAIGVSNFKIHHFEKLLASANVVPVLNQTELHPQYPQPELKEYCKKHSIAMEGWGPLMQGKIFGVPLFKELAVQYKKTISQLALRWALQMEFISIPKSTHKDRLIENASVFDFKISESDMQKIAGLNTGVKIGMDPDDVIF